MADFLHTITMILEYVLFKMLEKLLKVKSKTYYFLIYIKYLLQQISKFDEIMLPSRFIDPKLKLFRHIDRPQNVAFHLYNT